MGLRGPAAKEKPLRLIKFKAGVPPPPDWIDAEATEEYQRICQILVDSGEDLALVDMASLAIYAQCYSEVVTLTEEVRAHGFTLLNDKGQAYKNPATSVLNASRAALLKAIATLGFSPAARARIAIPKKRVGPENPFAAIMGPPPETPEDLMGEDDDETAD